MDLHVDRLTLHLPGVSEEDARRLALLLARRLAATETPDRPTRASRLSVSLVADPGEPLSMLAERIVGELRFAFARSS